MPKGHPLPFRLLSACFGKPDGASATVALSLSPRSAKGGTAASALCTAIFLHFWDLAQTREDASLWSYCRMYESSYEALNLMTT